MLVDNERLIIISGMGHSGTTILTYLLRQHPELFCYTNGNESHRLENDILISANTKELENLLSSYSGNILLKRPWTIAHHANWLLTEIPNAKFIYSFKTFEEISNSWCKPTSFVENKFRESLESQKEMYEDYHQRVICFKQKVNKFLTVKHKDILLNPQKTLDDVISFLELNPYNFDISFVGKKNIKDLLIKEQKVTCL